MRIGRIVGWAATALAAAVVLSACGGDASARSSGGELVRVPADLCVLLSGADVSQAVGRTFPAPRRTRTGIGGEQDCTAVPASGAAMSFTLFWGDCVDGKAPNQDCLTSVSSTYTTNRSQTISAVTPIAGLGEQAYCLPAPFATVEVLKRWIYLTVVADTCPQAQSLATTLLSRLG
ncbi:hypothetical protein A5647_20005 [Mycobacterium sp. 1100029.7]|nr:hypothetical protein A5647_20005 [Mycobacterium sp. 1100029.7]